MKEKLQVYNKQITELWKSRTRNQRILYVGIVLFLFILIAAGTFFATRTTMVPLYKDLSPSETGSIKEALDEKGIKSEITNNGTVINVPKESVNTLLVELAAEGVPKSGSPDYSYFSDNSGFGMTDNEFAVVKLATTQTEIANLIKEIDGVEDAKVLINLPEQGVFVNDSVEEASASIVLSTKQGQKFDDSQIKALYHLVSKSIANLPTDNIVIMNQYFEYYDLNNENNSSSGSLYANQRDIKQQVERDIQRQVQSMLGTLMGRDKVVVTVTADVDFTEEKRKEDLVTPVDEENMEGITISAQRITETYTGTKNGAGGVPETSDPADANGTNYLEESTNGNGDYEKTDETINSEVNRISKEIIESPYKLKDLGIQVMVEPPTRDDPNSLSQETRNDITKILGTIIRTSITKATDQESLTDEELAEKIAVSVQPFNGKVSFDSEVKTSLPWWTYLIGLLLLLVIIILAILFIRSKKRNEAEEELIDMAVPIEVPDVNDEQETESTVKRKQLEKLAKDKPDEFAKLLRTWIAEE